jgi:hypothetical protein
MTPSEDLPAKPDNILNSIDVSRFSRYGKLHRVIAYVLRFVGNCRQHLSNRKLDSITPEELHVAEKNLLKECQTNAFPEEIMKINSNGIKPSLVKQLRLFLDVDGCLRWRGRICYAQLDDDTKYPYLLPKKDLVTQL